MMTAEEAAAAAKGLTFEKVWAMFQETDRQIQERSRETDRRLQEWSREADRQIQERSQETDRQIQELSREADRQLQELSREADRRREELNRLQAETSQHIKELSKNIGGLNNSFGRWAEEMVSAKLWEKFRAIGYTFTRGGPQKYWEGSRTVLQVDMLLENGDYAMPVEIKSELTVEDVDDHLERIEKLREQFDKRGDRRKLVGAVAGMVVAENVKGYAQKKGLYVLVQSGDSVSLAEAPKVFKVREW